MIKQLITQQGVIFNWWQVVNSWGLLVLNRTLSAVWQGGQCISIVFWQTQLVVPHLR